MINLTDNEKKYILLCKGHFQEKYPFTGKWHKTLKPLFIEIYGWNPDEDDNYNRYLFVQFNKLLDIYLKIMDDGSDNYNQLKGIFDAAFFKGISNNSKLPIERAIHALCGLIQGNRILYDDDTERYSLVLNSK
jgi:hypothetical protein